jgi:hypothetical protein
MGDLSTFPKIMNSPKSITENTPLSLSLVVMLLAGVFFSGVAYQKINSTEVRTKVLEDAVLDIRNAVISNKQRIDAIESSLSR